MTRNDDGTITISMVDRAIGFVAMVVASAVSVGGFVLHTTNRISVIENRQDSDRTTLTDHGQRITKLESRHIEE